jgi:hypothetical protein
MPRARGGIPAFARSGEPRVQLVDLRTHAISGGFELVDAVLSLDLIIAIRLKGLKPGSSMPSPYVGRGIG